MLPQARNVMKLVPAVTRSERPLRVLGLLKEYGVAVLLDEKDCPLDILTTCDLDQVSKQVQQGLDKNASADALFNPQGRQVYSVLEDDDLSVVAQKISRHGLGTGIVVVDRAGKYLGYIFTSNLRATAESFAREVGEDVRRVKAQYPEAWSSVKGRSS